ncbi:hypothetical protein LIER_21080 [Lithospermum erythrorhizon]|uniref:BURP domain-containing protein n=1 Tax=Lithospermum erythrorhizon TaxID=34254 RepID=A0AAV3QNY8_LITER
MPRNEFKSYGDGGKIHVQTFKNYREGSVLGEDSFQSYSKNPNVPEVNFANYNQSFNHGNDDFTSYGENAKRPKVGFKLYGFHFENIFKRYAKNGNTSFAKYSNFSINSNIGRSKGVVMPVPNIRDKMSKRSFLPRSIAAKMPFSMAEIGQLKKVFHDEGAPSPGEIKQCMRSAEDMIDFATSVLGRNVEVKTTENTEGSDGNIMIGPVKAINGGKVTTSVSCHQSLVPYLMYYCHSVPKVRVYEADILDPQSKNDMTWTAPD